MRLIVLLLVVLLAAPAGALALNLPDSGNLPSDVRIERDAYGVPHVYSGDGYGLYWGNGYAQAQDRLFQMDALRHVGKGESAEYLGPSQLEMDLTTRRELYTQEERDATWAELQQNDPASAAMFGAFADGVNAFISETQANPSLLSAEFYAIGHLPEAWSAQDSIAIAQFLLDIFGAGSGGNEVDNAKLLVHLRATLGDDEAETAFNDFFWMHDASSFTTIDPVDGTYASTEGPLAFADIPADQWATIEAAAGAHAVGGAMSLQEAAEAVGLPTKFGSNAMVVAPAKSQNGGALLMGGPQMAYYNPMIPYEVALHGAGFDALGMGVGGAPGVIIGRTATYSWTVTSGSSDQVDAVAVKLVPGDNRSYYVSGTSGATAAMDCRLETHYGLPGAIDANPPVVAIQEVCRTSQGPVFAINDEMGYAFSRLRTHRLDELRSGLLWLTFSQAADINGIQDHMDSFCFEFNFMVAEQAGKIAYLHFGCQPVRDPRCDPRLPRLVGECDWTGVKSGRDLPHVINPTDGTIVQWNNRPAQGWSSGDAMEKWGPLNRVSLIENAIQTRLAANGGKVSMEDLKSVNIEISTRSPYTVSFVPALLAATAGSANATVQDARAALADWAANGYGWDAQGQTCVVMPSPNACFGKYAYSGFAIYEAWRGIVQDMTFADEMGPYQRVMGFVPEFSSDPHAADLGREDNKDNVLYNSLNGNTGHNWCLSANVSSCDDLLQQSFDAAVAQLTASFGTSDVNAWHQDLHTIKFSALSGGPAWRIPMVNRPSFPHYYDWGSGEAGSVLPPGTNQYWMPTDFIQFQADGSLPDAHKRDQLDLYANFEWKPAQMTPIGVESIQEFHPCLGGCALN